MQLLKDPLPLELEEISATGPTPPLSLIIRHLKYYQILLARKPILTPASMLANLDNSRLPALESAFSTHPNGLPVEDFVLLVESALEVKDTDTMNVVRALFRLFSEIDINGDGNMEWSEFTQYVIDTVFEESGKSRTN